jgi:hypothetical protein
MATMMRTATTCAAVCLVLAVAIAVPVSAAGPSPTATVAGKRDCGVQTYRSGGSAIRDRVSVLKGHATCKRARKVLRDFFAGKGKRHETPGEGMAGVSVTVDRWTCGYFAGGGACSKGSTKHPTDLIQSVDASL